MSRRELSQVAKELIAAKKKIENQENWCRDDLEDGDGRMCALGALTDEPIWERCSEALEASAWTLFHTDHVRVNDFLGHAAVMKMYDHAIATEIQKANS